MADKYIPPHRRRGWTASAGSGGDEMPRPQEHQQWESDYGHGLSASAIDAVKSFSSCISKRLRGASDSISYNNDAPRPTVYQVTALKEHLNYEAHTVSIGNSQSVLSCILIRAFEQRLWYLKNEVIVAENLHLLHRYDSALEQSRLTGTGEDTVTNEAHPLYVRVFVQESPRDVICGICRWKGWHVITQVDYAQPNTEFAKELMRVRFERMREPPSQELWEALTNKEWAKVTLKKVDDPENVLGGPGVPELEPSKNFKHGQPGLRWKGPGIDMNPKASETAKPKSLHFASPVNSHAETLAHKQIQDPKESGPDYQQGTQTDALDKSDEEK